MKESGSNKKYSNKLISLFFPTKEVMGLNNIEDKANNDGAPPDDKMRKRTLNDLALVDTSPKRKRFDRSLKATKDSTSIEEESPVYATATAIRSDNSSLICSTISTSSEIKRAPTNAKQPSSHIPEPSSGASITPANKPRSSCLPAPVTSRKSEMNNPLIIPKNTPILEIRCDDDKVSTVYHNKWKGRGAFLGIPKEGGISVDTVPCDKAQGDVSALSDKLDLVLSPRVDKATQKPLTIPGNIPRLEVGRDDKVSTVFNKWKGRGEFLNIPMEGGYEEVAKRGYTRFMSTRDLDRLKNTVALVEEHVSDHSVTVDDVLCEFDKTQGDLSALSDKLDLVLSPRVDKALGTRAEMGDDDTVTSTGSSHSPASESPEFEDSSFAHSPEPSTKLKTIPLCIPGNIPRLEVGRDDKVSTVFNKWKGRGEFLNIPMEGGYEEVAKRGYTRFMSTRDLDRLKNTVALVEEHVSDHSVTVDDVLCEFDKMQGDLSALSDKLDLVLSPRVDRSFEKQAKRIKVETGYHDDDNASVISRDSSFFSSDDEDDSFDGVSLSIDDGKHAPEGVITTNTAPRFMRWRQTFDYPVSQFYHDWKEAIDNNATFQKMIEDKSAGCPGHSRRLLKYAAFFDFIDKHIADIGDENMVTNKWDEKQGSCTLGYVADHASGFRRLVDLDLKPAPPTVALVTDEIKTEWSPDTGLSYRPRFWRLVTPTAISKAYEEWTTGGKVADPPFRGGMVDILKQHRDVFLLTLSRHERNILDKFEEIFAAVDAFAMNYALKDVLKVADAYGANISMISCEEFRRHLKDKFGSGLYRALRTSSLSMAQEPGLARDGAASCRSHEHEQTPKFLLGTAFPHVPISSVYNEMSEIRDIGSMKKSSKLALARRVAVKVDSLFQETNCELDPFLDICDTCQGKVAITTVLREWDRFAAKVLLQLKESPHVAPQQLQGASKSTQPIQLCPSWSFASKVFISTLYCEFLGKDGFHNRPVPGGLQAYFELHGEHVKSFSADVQRRFDCVQPVVVRIGEFLDDVDDGDTSKILDQFDIAQRGRDIPTLAEEIEEVCDVVALGLKSRGATFVY